MRLVRGTHPAARVACLHETRTTIAARAPVTFPNGFFYRVKPMFGKKTARDRRKRSFVTFRFYQPPSISKKNVRSVRQTSIYENRVTRVPLSRPVYDRNRKTRVSPKLCPNRAPTKRQSGTARRAGRSYRPSSAFGTICSGRGSSNGTYAFCISPKYYPSPYGGAGMFRAIRTRRKRSAPEIRRFSSVPTVPDLIKPVRFSNVRC